MFHFIYITKNKVYKAQVTYMQNIEGSLICLTFLSPPQAQ